MPTKIKLNEVTRLVKLLQNYMIDPTRVAIWFEILRKPGITAYELMDVINIKKTAMYYHLKILEKENIISYTIDKKQKHYKILINFFDLFEAKDHQAGIEKEFDLFSLYIVNSLVQREINRISNIPSDQYEKRKYPIQYLGMWFSSKAKLNQVKHLHKEMYRKILEIDADEGSENITNTDLVYYWGISDFE